MNKISNKLFDRHRDIMSGRIPYHRDINIVIEETLNLLSSSIIQIRLEELPLKNKFKFCSI
jgi:hypothetical protein